MEFSISGFEVSVPVLVLGLVTGLTYGLLAVGLVLVYRSNRILNFAHGEIGAFAAALLGLAVIRWQVPYWVAFPVALAAGAGVGGVSELVVVRRLRNAPLLMSIVATLGLGQFLLVFALVVNSQAGQVRLFPQPAWLPEFHIGALLVTRAYTGMILMTPLLVIALVLFLRGSRFGLAIRASAANADAARLAGVSASRMSTLSWAIAGAVSAFTAILLLPTGATSAGLLGPGLLLRALAAAVIGRMVSLPIALVAGLGVGITEQLLLWNYPQGGHVDAVLFVLILVALLVQTQQSARSEDRGNWATVQPWPPLPDAILSVWSIRNMGRILAALALAGALVFPLMSTNATAIIVVLIMAFSLVGLSLGIVTGLAGQLSLGQFALAGVGATASFAITDRTGNFLFGFAGAGLVAAAASLIIGLPALRIRGLLLAVTTIGFALAAQGWLLRQRWMLGEGVDTARPVIGSYAFDTGKRYYYFVLAVLVFGFWIARNVWKGGIGRQLRAVRDNEAGARSFTVRPTRVKLQAFMLGGFLAGLGGAAYGHAISRLSATAFPVGANIDVAAMTVLGGVGLLAGPLLGALYIIGIPRFLPLDNAGLAATALGWLALVLYAPGGIAQLIRPLRDGMIEMLGRRSGVAVETAPAEPEAAPDFTRAVAQATTVQHRSSSDQAALTVSHLSKQYGGVKAVDDVSFEVGAGETLGLIGPNGAGKTTVFELIGGFLRADGGTVMFAGTDVTRLPPEGRARQGLIRSFQDAELFPTLTVLDAVELSFERISPTRFLPSVLGRQASERDKERQAREVIALMGLDHFRNHQIRALSTGTRRVTELACLMALRPAVLLLDEPSSGIAQRESESLGELLLRLKQQLDLTLVVIEHDIPLVTAISDRMIAMEAGRVIAQGAPEAVLDDAQVVAAYLGGDPRAIARSNQSSKRRTRPIRAGNR